MNSSLDSFILPRSKRIQCCRVSDPAHPHTLCLRLGALLPHSACFTCGKQDPPCPRNYHYYCPTCDLQFHSGCHMYPPMLRHPYHLQHPLTFTFSRNGTLVSDGNISEIPLDMSDSGQTSGQCDWCGQHLRQYFYRCSICTFSLDSSCSRKYPLPTITNPKSHHHALTLLPRPLSFPCDACGVADMRDPTYACLQCNYVVHQSCDGLPRVIKLTYHPHRLSLTLSLPPESSSCPICQRKVDVKYGAYSCKESCRYRCLFHSNCATHDEVWDSKDLEWEPEEPDAVEDIEPFKKIGDKEIIHFSHDHHRLWLNHGVVLHDHGKQCQACILPIDSGDFYSCLQCDFFLHAACASLPRKKDHELHKHPLILDPLSRHENRSLTCSACRQISSGFMYKCSKRNCASFQLDVRCASVSELLNHKTHQHSLFISRDWDLSHNLSCMNCHQSHNLRYHLKCIDHECGFIMCFRCATLPNEVRYKYDEHPLYLCCGEDASGLYWCEVCEEKLDSREWFYTCHTCCVTLHVECVFRPTVSIRAGYCFNYWGSMFDIVRSNSMTRPVCRRCGKRCPGTLFFRYNNDYFCSFHYLRFHPFYPEKDKASRE